MARLTATDRAGVPETRLAEQSAGGRRLRTLLCAARTYRHAHRAGRPRTKRTSIARWRRSGCSLHPFVALVGLPRSAGGQRITCPTSKLRVNLLTRPTAFWATGSYRALLWRPHAGRSGDEGGVRAGASIPCRRSSGNGGHARIWQRRRAVAVASLIGDAWLAPLVRSGVRNNCGAVFYSAILAKVDR